LNYNFSQAAAGEYHITMSAVNGSTTVTDEKVVIILPAINVASAPAGTIDGINVTSTSGVRLQLYAPNKSFVFVIGDFMVTKSILMMVLFAMLMVAASISMIRGKSEECDKEKDENFILEVQVFNYPMILLEGAVVGILTGLVGAGGGFLIIPALVMLSKLSMKQAIGTSLLIIAAKSLIGFTGDLGHQIIDWKLLLTVTGLAIVGIFLGDIVSKKIDGNKLKAGFGWFVLIMGVFILVQQLAFPIQ
jgi:hypothetical protein